MGDSIKKYFSKLKSGSRFKTAGPGRKLNDARPAPSPARKKDVYQPPVRSGLSDESKQAAAAAMSRLEGKKTDAPRFNTSLAAIRAQAKRELEAEKLEQSTSGSGSEKKVQQKVTNAEDYAVAGVFFRCPAIDDEVLPKNEWDAKIRGFLEEQMPSDPGLTPVLMLHSLNKNKEKVQVCVDTLSKYFENILREPGEEKFRKIRKTNKLFLDRVAPLEGSDLVLKGAGFVSEEEFYIFPDTSVCDEGLQNLEMILDALKCAEPITLHLDRNMQVLIASQASKRREVPPDFFRISPEELKREQQIKQEAIERSSMLMTKAMREKEELRELRNFKYCLIRVRFPDGILLQGTFGAYEPFSEVIEFLKGSINNPDGAFTLISPLGETLSKSEEKSLIDLRLVPASLLIFQSQEETHLKPEVILMCQEFKIA